MRVFLKNIHNSYNYGSMMMAENVITYLNKNLAEEELEYYTEAKTESDLERLIEATNYKKIFRNPVSDTRVMTEKIKYVRYIERKIRVKMKLNKLAEFYDAIIILGGDDYAETYYKLPQANDAIKANFRNLKKLSMLTKVFMVGQTIGPYTGKRVKWASDAFVDIDIYSRDDVSAKYVKDVMHKQTKKTRDLAFLDLGLQKEYLACKSEILNKYGIVENGYITIVGTGLIKHYTKNEDRFIDSFYDMIKAVNEKYKDKKIVWLSHVLTPGTIYNDLYLLGRINEKYENYINLNCVVINTPVLPAEARVVLGLGYFTITCRMHAAVSTYQMGKPAICLSYSQKYKGVISDGLGRGDLVIEAKNDLLWQKGIADIVLEKTDYVIKNYQRIIKEIVSRVDECKQIVKDTFNEISYLIKH